MDHGHSMKNNKQEKVFIIIALHNRLNYTKTCLKSLKAQTYKKYSLIIVDDGSTDGTSEFIKRNYPQVQIIPGDGNLWWTKSMALGVESALKQSRPGDFVLSLNNDCFFEKNYLENIIKTSIENGRSIAGSLVIDSTNKTRVIEAGIRIDWKKSLIYGLSDKMSDKAAFYKNRSVIKDLDTLPGKGTLIPIEVFKKIGNFNYKRLPHYIGDYEFFCRARRNGINLIVSTNSTLYNFSKATGTVHLDGMYSSYVKVLKAMFSRKSKINILDYLNFILLCCPTKYLRVNLNIVFGRFMYFIVNMFPFCYISLIYQKTRIFIHNLPIYIRQNFVTQKVLMLFHNIPIYLKQNKYTGKFFKMGNKKKCKICKQKKSVLYLKNLFDNRHGYKGKFDIYRCNNCKFMNTYPELTFAKLTEIYSTYYPKRDANIKDIIKNSKNLPTKKDINKNGWETTCHFQTKKGDKVLDIGCGTCQSLLEIKKLGGDAYGIDVDNNSLKVAEALKVKFQLGTIHNCHFPKNYFDLITASQVIEHEPDPIRFLINCKKYLKTGGKMILSFPNTGALYRKIWGKKWLHWHIPYHLNHFDKKTILELANLTGFKISSIKTVTPNLWTILQIRSFINNKKEGQRDRMWDGIVETENYDVKNFFVSFLSKSLPIFNNLLFVNRFIDYLKLGESFVVELKTK